MNTSAQRFLHSLFGDAPAGTFLLLWTLQDRRSAWFRADRLGEAAAYAADIGQHGDVYAGCGLRGRDHGEHARGEVAHVVAISGTWCDLDVAKPGATKPYFKTRGDATVFLDDLPIPPTLRMWTGGGYHGWWLFREPWLFGDADDRDRASRCFLSQA